MSEDASHVGTPVVALIAALADNRVIGRDNDLPWRMPADLRHFKELTTGHTVVMGRRTWESFPGALPYRRNVVVTRDPDYVADGAVVVHSLDEALRFAAEAGDAELFIAGGSQIYGQALPIARRMYLTHIHAAIEGDTFFPEFDADAWRVTEKAHHAADERHAHAYTFATYERV